MFIDTFPAFETTGYIDKTCVKKKHNLWFQPQERNENRQREYKP